MLYRNDIAPYKRSENGGKLLAEKGMRFFTSKHLILYMSAFFASRVLMLNELMPFGLAFFTAAFGALEKQVAILTGIAGCIGYISVMKGYLGLSHVLALMVLMIAGLLLDGKSKTRIYKMSFLAFVVNTSMSLIVHMRFISGSFVLYDMILALLESTVIMACSYIFTYGMPLYFQNKKRKILSREEMVCLGLMLAVAISGMPDIKIVGMSLRNMIALFVVLVSGYVEGPAMGAASGVALGLISSISNASMPVSLGIYALCGLVGGIFKDLGKGVTALSFVISGALLTFYTSSLLNINTIYLDTIVPALVFLIIPSKHYEKFALLIDGEKRAIELQKSYIERVKDIMGAKLTSISTTLSGLSDILEQNIDHELSKKVEISGMVEKLADKVCGSCDGKGLCWQRELYYTYDSFVELLRIVEKKGKIGISDIPDSLKRRCIRPTELVKQANYIFEIYRLNNKWKRKLLNSKKIVADQIIGISGLVGSMVEEVSTSMEFKNDIEEEISIALDRKGLEFDDVVAIKNHRNKYEVTIYTRPCGGKHSCSREFVGTVSKALGVRMVRDANHCKINPECSMCQFTLLEAENYNVVSAVAKLAKEDVSGDSYSFSHLEEGRYMLALSDGMGSGSRAAVESTTTISLLEKFMEAGFERNTAIKAINSVLVLKSSEESFTTIDMGLIDLYSGIGEFVKIGSAPTFVKSGREVDVIKSTSLPVGILDEIDIESQIVEFKNGDMIIMVSDGIADANQDLKEKWVSRTLKEFDSGNPKDVADYLLNKAKEQYKGRLGDDMTVIVSKIWKVM